MSIMTQPAMLRCKSPLRTHIRPIAVESSSPRHGAALQPTYNILKVDKESFPQVSGPRRTLPVL